MFGEHLLDAFLALFTLTRDSQAQHLSFISISRIEINRYLITRLGEINGFSSDVHFIQISNCDELGWMVSLNSICSEAECDDFSIMVTAVIVFTENWLINRI